MHKKRPRNLNLFTIHFPITAIVSILHRVSGVLLFLLVPMGLWAFNYSLASPDNFRKIQVLCSLFWLKLIIWLLLLPFCFHLVAGFRHLLMDVHIGETLQGGRLTAFLTMIISLLLAIGLGAWLW